MTAATALLQVLLVEDDLADVALMESSFAEHQEPTELHHVVDGADALAFLRREGRYADVPRPDLILLDLNMPRVDGRQVLAAIKADEKLKAIPVVVFTTSAAPADVSSSYGAHANAYITKPIDLDQFDRVVAQIRSFYGHTVTLPPRPGDANRNDGSTGDPTNSTPPA
ncbi:response regulator [Actinoplanes sp. NPDC051475]|uniref:response regulator n=1 Tax=Actinoplanes sp. NPDC051475 TaxID=3157225 RepID=UPI00344B31B9